MLPSIKGSPLSGGSDDHTRIVPRADPLDDRTTIVPMVRRPSRLRTLLPWVGFGLVAVVVVATTTAWASTLRGPDDPLLANATPPAVLVAPASSVPTPAAAPVAETTVPAATTLKPVRPTLARVVVPPKPVPSVVATPTAKPTSAATTTTKAATVATTTKQGGMIDLSPSEQCTPTAAKPCPAANQAGSTARNPTP